MGLLGGHLLHLTLVANVVAAAYGVPPGDADTIQGAELWAL